MKNKKKKKKKIKKKKKKSGIEMIFIMNVEHMNILRADILDSQTFLSLTVNSVTLTEYKNKKKKWNRNDIYCEWGAHEYIEK